MGEIKRIYPEEPEEINESLIETSMDVNMPMFMIGFKDAVSGDKLKDQIAIEIAVNSLLGKCSETYQDMYNEAIKNIKPVFDTEARAKVVATLRGTTDELHRVSELSGEMQIPIRTNISRL